MWCPSERERDAALGWLSRVTLRKRPDPTYVSLIATDEFAPLPDYCDVSMAPIQGKLPTSALRIEMAEVGQLYMIDGVEQSAIRIDGVFERPLLPGPHDVVVGGGGFNRPFGIRCHVSIEAGHRTTLHIAWNGARPGEAPTKVHAPAATQVSARTTLMTVGGWSRRRTFRMTRSDDHVQLDVRVERSPSEHLANRDVAWDLAGLAQYTGDVETGSDGRENVNLRRAWVEGDISGTIEVSLDEAMTWHCSSKAVAVRPAAALPYRDRPNPPSACLGAHHKWKPETIGSSTVWECTTSERPLASNVAFTPELSVETVREYIDCWIQSHDEYRFVDHSHQ